MNKKLSILKLIFFFLCSATVLAEETAVTETPAEAKESQSIIKQTIAAEADAKADAKAPGASEVAQEKLVEKPKAWIPSAVEYDWIQLTSNEWLKGEIKGMYKDSLEFDSDKLNLLTIKWKDVKILRSHSVNNVNIEGVGATSGILEVTDASLQIISDYEDQTYDRSKLISFAPGGKTELDLWSGKAVLGIDLRQGNTNQLDYSARVNIKRRASTTRFLMDYNGNISKTNSGEGSLVETVNNHRLAASYDYYKTRYFYYTPVFAELYRDPFTNIALRTTLATGLGYTVIDNGKTELSFGGGPAFVKTEFISVAEGEASSESTPAAVLRTNYDTELNTTLDFIAKYNIQIGNEASGGYTHHIILTLESEIIGSLDIDTSFVWDRTSSPAEAADGTTPAADDYRITLGLSYTY